MRRQIFMGRDRVLGQDIQGPSTFFPKFLSELLVVFGIIFKIAV